jgi:hypothetical protein
MAVSGTARTVIAVFPRPSFGVHARSTDHSTPRLRSSALRVDPRTPQRRCSSAPSIWIRSSAGDDPGLQGGEQLVECWIVDLGSERMGDVECAGFSETSSVDGGPKEELADRRRAAIASSSSIHRPAVPAREVG